MIEPTRPTPLIQINNQAGGRADESGNIPQPSTTKPKTSTEDPEFTYEVRLGGQIILTTADLSMAI